MAEGGPKVIPSLGTQTRITSCAARPRIHFPATRIGITFRWTHLLWTRNHFHWTRTRFASSFRVARLTFPDSESLWPRLGIAFTRTRNRFPLTGLGLESDSLSPGARLAALVRLTLPESLSRDLDSLWVGPESLPLDSESLLLDSESQPLDSESLPLDSDSLFAGLRIE